MRHIAANTAAHFGRVMMLAAAAIVAISMQPKTWLLEDEDDLSSAMDLSECSESA